MGFEAGKMFFDYKVDKVFVGLCINLCIEDMCVVVVVVKGKKVVFYV